MSALPPGERMTLLASDGYSLTAMRFGAGSALRGHIVVAGATGVPQTYYARFAGYAASRGFTTLTFDYRGIGQSKPESLAGFEASFVDWARLDLAAAVEQMASDTVPLFVVGHSFGGHAIGLLPNEDDVAAHYVFGAGAGWHGWMTPLERVRVKLIWNVVLPPLVRWKGYLPWSLLDMGEDLPLGVYHQWRRWCRYPHYFLDDPTATELRELCMRVRAPLAAANALDDAWAPPRSRDAFLLNAYRNAQVDLIDIDPHDFGPIGHMGYFRRTASPLWERALDWFAERHIEG
ncbi:alpha/beta hydrolase family protein [Archangium lansingense]|uniref:Alpha/beta fold hydrolase n=1 Tax=Archangium lansingense TaxID=2995310 RepID=A0ABT4ABP9_9BACT|nr:alpha/beta fold hydrolase [Archangium lansinium]MCY1079108.1 alpha/beta fold hydrolase [Archangium lansinium]